MPQEICRSLRTRDRALARRRLAQEMEKTSRVDPALGKTTLEELLRLYEAGLSRYAPRTAAIRRSILKRFKGT